MKRSIVCAALLGMFVCNANAETKIVKIGSGAPKSGGIAELGQDNELGAQLAVDDINTAGLVINGQEIQLQLVGEDDEGDAKQGVEVAQKIVDSGAVAVVGHLNSGVSIPANFIYAAAGMAQVSPSSTNPEYTLARYVTPTPKGNHSAYRVVAHDMAQGRMLAKWLVKHNAKRVAVLDDSTQYGKGLADYVAEGLDSANVEIVSRENVTDTTLNFRFILTKLKAENPDYIFWGGMDDTGAALAKQIKQLGLKAKLISGDGLCTYRFMELSDKAAEGVVCSQGGEPLSSMSRGKWFGKHFAEKNNREVQIYAPYAYDAVYAIVEAMKIAQSTEREAIAAAMPSVDFEGVTGRIRFDKHGDIQNGAITFTQYHNGKMKTVGTLR